jgi:hypothetical protein
MACSTPCDPSATPAPVTTTPEIMCCKCRTLPSTILVRRSKYCRYKSTILIPSPCFLGSIPGRFRTNLTRCQNIGARPLLAISGGASSTTLLHLLNNGQDEEDVRRRKYESVRVVHIDDGGIVCSFELIVLGYGSYSRECQTYSPTYPRTDDYILPTYDIIEITRCEIKPTSSDSP